MVATGRRGWCLAADHSVSEGEGGIGAEEGDLGEEGGTGVPLATASRAGACGFV